MTGKQAQRRARALRARADALIREADALDTFAAALITSGESGSLTPMDHDHRLAISAARRGGELAAAARAHGYSLRSLAAAIGVSHVYLCHIQAGLRPASDQVASRLAELVGWRRR